MSSQAEKSLQVLLRSMQPSLLEGTYAYVTLPSGLAIPPGITPLASFREPEGWSLIVTEAEAARAGLLASFFCRGIALSVHSSLYAVGFLAAVSERLARAGMSINIVSAYHRDYVFIPSARAHEALEVLRKLAQDGA